MAVNHNYDPIYIGPHKVLCVRAVLVAVALFLTQIYSGRMHGKSQEQVESSQLGYCLQETERGCLERNVESYDTRGYSMFRMKRAAIKKEVNLT